MWIGCRLVRVSFFTAALALFAPAAARGAFTVVVLPDTQLYSENYPEIFATQTQWIVDHAAEQNIRFVTHVGDIVQNFASGPDRNLVEWQRADAAMRTLDPVADLPYSVSLGNHDYDVGDDNAGTASRYVEFFGPGRYAGRSWYGGSSPDGRNHYQFFTGDGQTFLHLNLEFEPPEGAIQWADSIIHQHFGVPTILTTHKYLDFNALPAVDLESTGGSPASAVFSRLVFNHPQVFMVFSGHRPAERHSTMVNIAGAPVLAMLADYQARANGGDGWLRLVHFEPENSRIWVQTYSPTRGSGLGEFERDPSSEFEFTMNFAERFAVPPVPEPHTAAMIVLALIVYAVKRAASPPLAATSPSPRVPNR
jgi:hypothetical protein